MYRVSWISLDGAVNVRDLGGLPTVDGRRTAENRLIRSDNLQNLSPRDVAHLVEDVGVRTVADLRTGVEVETEGPAPLHHDPRVEVRHLSLFPEAGRHTDAAAAEKIDGRVILPWEARDAERGRAASPTDIGTAGVYLGYLEHRPDSVVETLRVVAHSPGATIVHCAAGKDRTGTVVALTLAEVGVTQEAIVADYLATGQRVYEVFARLEASPTYREDVRRRPPEDHAPRPETMPTLLDAIERRWGGVGRWLRTHGWSEQDAAALRGKLLAG